MNERQLVQDIRKQGIQPKHIEQLIDMHKHDRERMMRLYERYKVSQGAVPIHNHDPVKEYENFETGGNVRRIDQYVNNRLNNPFDVEIVDTREGYLHGVPISYSVDDENQKKMVDEFNAINNVADKDSHLGKMAAICGYSARLVYIGRDGDPRIANLKPYNVVFLGADMSEPEYSMHYYDIKDEETGQTTWHAEFYDDGYYHTFEGGQEAMRFIEKKEHMSDYVPLFGVPNNEELIGDVERVLALIDGYDRTLSDASSEISQTRLAYLVLKGFGMDDTEIAELEKGGAFELYDEKQDVKYLTKDVNDQMIENHLNRLEKNIMRFAKSVNFNSDEFNGNVPVIGMRLKLMALENKCITFERKMTAMLRYQFKVLYSIWKRKNSLQVGEKEYLNVKFKWTRNIPVNKLEEAQVLSTLNGQVSDRTRYGLSTLVDDAEEEVEQRDAEMIVTGVGGDESE